MLLGLCKWEEEEGRAAGRGHAPPQSQQQKEVKHVVRWKCVTGCGACCKKDKDPDFPTPEEIFADHPDDLQLYKSMIGTDGWCTKYDKSTRTCTIYQGAMHASLDSVLADLS
ncbi:hypothetical protein ABZP36_005777 [Zizania latifolia]